MIQIFHNRLKNLFLLSSILGLSLIFSSCLHDNIWIEPSGIIAEKVYSTKGIRKIVAGNCFRIILSKGNTESVRIETDDNVMPFVEFLQQGDCIRCGFRSNLHIHGNQRVDVYVTYTDRFNELDLRGASSAYFSDSIAYLNTFEGDLSGASFLEGNILAQKIQMELSGGSKAFMSINARNIELDLSGSSTIRGNANSSFMEVDLSGSSALNLQGECRTLEMELSGASVFEFLDYTADYVSAKLSGSSEAYCTINEQLNLSASGGSVFYYRGNIGFGNLALSGGARLQKMN